MKQYTMYVCEVCCYESRDADEVERHEAKHLGLAVGELHKYNALKSFVVYMGGVISHTSNEETRAKYDKAIDDLMAFEKEHKIK